MAKDYDRVRQLVDGRVLASRVEFVAGAGRAGSSYVRQRLGFPIRKIIQVDDDAVSGRDAANAFPAAAVGDLKVEALGRQVEEWNDSTAYEGLDMRVTRETLPLFLERVVEADMLIWCMDDWEMLEHVSTLLHDQIPMVGTAFAEGGAYGEVAFSIPGQTPPLAETLSAENRERADGASSLPLDVDLVINIAVRVAVGISLIGRKGFELFAPYLDPDHPLIIVQSRPNSFTESNNELVPQLTRLIRSG